jgi:hypothetical protein
MAISKKKIDVSKQPELFGVKNNYDPFDLKFLRTDEHGEIWNGEFKVTGAPQKLRGVPTGEEEIRLTDYLVHRPVPKEVIAWQNIPNYHPDSLDMENWYQPLADYCYDGVWVDGEYWNPYMMYWLNIFVFPVPIYDEHGDPTEDFETSYATYCNIDRYFFDYCWKAELMRLDCAIMGGRGVGKSYMYNCILDREYRLFPGAVNVVSSTNEDTTNEAWDKIEKGMEAIEAKHRALKYKRLTDSSTRKEAGEIVELPDGTTEKRGHLAVFEKIIYGKNAGKTRGKRPRKQLFEEFAAFPPSHQKGSLRACMRESRGSWWVMGSIKKCTVLYSGTGGTVENDEAEGVFCNPKSNGILPTHDFPDAPNGSGFFCPTHIKRAGTWEKTGCPDVTQATLEVKEEREAAKGDTESYMGLLQEYPMNIREVFTRRGVNIFNQERIAAQRIRIEHEKDCPKPERGFLKWLKNEAGKNLSVVWEPSTVGDIEIIEHPYWLTEQSREDEKAPMNNLYVGGCDSIDQGTMDSSYATDSRRGSELGILIKKRVVDGNYWGTTSNIYVAKYVKRSANVRSDWDNALKLAVYYNAEVNIEYTKIGIVGWFRDQGYYRLLKKRPTINLTSGDPSKLSHLVGTTAAGPIIDHQDQKIAAYLEDYSDEIWFPDILQQLQDYNREDRTKFDLVIAMGLCELADEDLMGKAAKPPSKATEGFQLYGCYTDPVTGYKKHGLIPDKKSGKDELDTILKEAAEFRARGSVRWIDASDPDNVEVHYQ